MSGIAGIARVQGDGVAVETLSRMAAAIRHRGPDGYGFYASSNVGLAHVRLSTIDPDGGAQPMTNAIGDVVVTFDGVIFNHPELRRELEARGYSFQTRSDTEVLLHAYEEWGAEVVHRINGQFAFAIYNAGSQTLLFARDRFGVRPLFYSVDRGNLYFASEIKALVASGDVHATIDPAALDEVFTFRAPRAPRTGFSGIAALEPGTYALWRRGSLNVRRYYELDFCESDIEPHDAVETLDELLRSGVSMRMRADIPVGAYLSGGLDSSITAGLAAVSSSHPVRSFSITSSDPRFDNSRFQREIASAIGSDHTLETIGDDSIAESFPDVVWHAETPLAHTSLAPMYHLARLAREHGVKAVLTGEGADELFLGYDLFKEVAARGGERWHRYFIDGSPSDPLFSHLPSFGESSWVKDFYSPAFAASLARTNVVSELRDTLPARYFGWSPLNRAAYLEMTLRMSSYLLGAQGDRMAMAHGVETRFPFLDHRLFEFVATLPTNSRLRGGEEKEILRRWATRGLAASASMRPKSSQRAADLSVFVGPNAPAYVADVLSSEAIRSSGVWSEQAVDGLVRRCQSGQAIAPRDHQALVAVLSTQLWSRAFVSASVARACLNLEGADVLIQDNEPAGV